MVPRVPRPRPYMPSAPQTSQGSSSRSKGKPVNSHELEVLPSMDNARYYDPPASPSSSSDSAYSDAPAPHDLTTNSGNKLVYHSRFMRKGKSYPWGPAFEEAKLEKRSRKRLKRALETVFPDASADLGLPPPANILDAERKREKKRKHQEEDREYQLPHLRSPSPPATTARLAPTLAIPQSYTDIMLSSAMRHTMADDKMDRGLMDTSNELLESEKGLSQALGRLREVLRIRGRDVPAAPPPVTNGDEDDNLPIENPALGVIKQEPNGVDDMPSRASTPGLPPVQVNSKGEPLIPPLPRIAETDNLWRVTQELLQSTTWTPEIGFSVTKPGTAAKPQTPYTHPLTPVQSLFCNPAGFTLTSTPNPQNPGFAYPEGHVNHPRATRYNVDLAAQVRATDDAIERIMELLVDCNEYKERLEETRDRVADIARVRKKVWTVVKERAGRELGV